MRILWDDGPMRMAAATGNVLLRVPSVARAVLRPAGEHVVYTPPRPASLERLPRPPPPRDAESVHDWPSRTDQREGLGAGRVLQS